MVPVEAQQRVGVEEQRRGEAHEEQDEAEVANHAGLDREPDQERRRADPELDQDAGGADREALPVVAEPRRRRGIDVGRGCEAKKRHPELAHPAAPAQHGEGVSELVKQLHERIARPC